MSSAVDIVHPPVAETRYPADFRRYLDHLISAGTMPFEAARAFGHQACLSAHDWSELVRAHCEIIASSPHRSCDTGGVTEALIAALIGWADTPIESIPEAASRQHSRDAAKAVRSIDDDARQAASAASGVAMTVRMVKGMMGEISGRIQQTTQSVGAARGIADRAVQEVGRTTNRAEELTGAVQRVTTLTDLIREISAHTNLLAMNARIEAAHAGTQGAGFAVVANEVKQLANRSIQATREIGSALEALRTAHSDVSNSIMMLRECFAQICEQINVIAGNVSEDRSVIETVGTFSADAAQASEEILTTLERLEAVAHQASAALVE